MGPNSSHSMVLTLAEEARLVEVRRPYGAAWGAMALPGSLNIQDRVSKWDASPPGPPAAASI